MRLLRFVTFFGGGILVVGLAASALSPACSTAAPPRVTLSPAFGGRVFDRPVELAQLPEGDFLVAEKDGLLLQISPDGSRQAVVLDMRERVSLDHEEQGLLSFALAPDFGSSGEVWLYYTAAGENRSVLSRVTLRDGVIEPSTELIVLEVRQPYRNHNGGAVRFGPDGMLYLGLGDGGSFFDPFGNAQNPETLLGSILRLDVSRSSPAERYRIPKDNPFLDREGYRPEIFAYGFRNPWRMDFDPETGQLWVGDVGQHAYEEVDLVEAGGNYGWNLAEGHDCLLKRCPAGMKEPVETYGRDDGCAIVGGPVYRGPEQRQLAGKYIFGDFCTGSIWTLKDGDRQRIAASRLPILSFGTDLAGEVYVLQDEGPVLRLGGEGALERH